MKRITARYLFAVAIPMALAVTIALSGCGSSSKNITKSQIDSSAVTSEQAKNGDPFTVLDDQGKVDSALVESKLESARQEWLRALAAEQRKDKDEAVKRFEASIDILNRLIYYPGVSENRDFQELTRSVFEDYEKYVNRIDVLPPSSSIYAFRQKFNEEMAKMDIKNIPLPKPADISHTQVPLVINPAVEQSIAYFMSGNGRSFMQKWLNRSGKFFPMMKKIFHDEGTPEELIYLSMIESGLNPTVTSRAAAVGLWQFIDGTGALYGLKSNWWFDNKRDPIKETRAAARHLKDLYRAMGDWYLALSCYNCSMTRIKRCMAESQDTTFWGIRDCLPRETQNYIPLYIAATLIAMDPARYGFTDIQLEKPMAFDTVYVHESVDFNALALAAGTTNIEIKDLNPELLQGCTPPPELCDATGYCLRVPVGASQNFSSRYALLTSEQKRPWMLHTVQRGETLRSIAKTYGITTDQLAGYNNLDASERVKRGSKLRVPMSVMSPSSVASNETHSSTGLTAPMPKDTSSKSVASAEPTAPTPTNSKKVYHRVRRGETLNSIASHYGVRVSDIRNWNDISYQHRLKKGERLAIYIERAAEQTKKEDVASSSTQHSSKHWINYKVRRGDTMAKIADDFGVSLSSIKKWNSHAVKHGVRSGQQLRIYTSEQYTATSDEPSVSEKPRTHTVRPGETMTSIAKLYGTSVDQLSQWNGGKDPASLQAGEKLSVYAANKTASQGDSDHSSKSSRKVTYRVRRGDTLYSIAEKYGVSVTDLKEANHLSKNKIPAGKRLVIPAE